MTAPSSAKQVSLLSQLEPGQSGRVLRVHGHGPQGLRQRLLDMGVTRGAEVRMLRRAPLGDPVEFAICGYCLALRLSEAREVELEIS
jgi:Fe2+ transport system protein FeoA